ncbi:PREDICTED: probable transcriptional regulator SLK3 [Ipomoea nil]|uniref:probable transcriptional regulator SLK3 n=1 Tax=Ipomoea nil TaxID=35883 RepID=UPI00090152CC|nr:PREDICTED: probable transcriptional regulator SLK3 [Ipomoea nil]XP_019179552.1 PREDICTED: probable transcriptional regulator SLK3 [Ipomoea nil]
MDMGGSSGSYGYGDFLESWVSDNSSRNQLEPLSYSFGSLLSSTSTDMSQVNNAQLDYNEVMNTTVVNRSLDSLVVPSFGANYGVNDANLLLPTTAFFHIPGIHYSDPVFLSTAMSFAPNNNGFVGNSYYPVGLVNSGMGDSYPAGLNKLSCHSSKREQSGSMVSSGGAESAGFDVYQTGIGIETEAQLSKKPRLDQDATKDVLLHPEIIFEKSLVQLQEKNSVLQALLEQQRQQNELHKQLSLLGTEDQLLQQWELMQNQAQLSSLPCLDASICNRRLTQYLYHTRSRPINSDMTYWKKFVSEYYAPCAKQRLCFSTCVNVSQQALNLFTDTALESWCCSICASKSSKGFEVIYETLPRLFKTKYESTMLDEILFLGLPREHRFPSGLIMLEYDKVVQESIYEDFRIVHEGILRVIFRPDLKIFSWEFCVQRHEELLKYRSVARQVDHFVEAAQKYRSTITNLAGTSLKDMQSCCNMFLTAELELARNVELPLVNALGFSKKHFRCLQIAEIVGSMTDLITISHELGVGPIESLKNYRRLKEVKEQRTNHSVTSTDDGGLAADNSYSRLLRQGARSSVARTQVLQPSYSTANSSQLEVTANERMKSIEHTVDKLLSAKEATLRANSLGNAISEVGGTAISGAWPQISDTITLADAMNFGENAAALAVAQANLNLMANAQPSGPEMCKAAFNSSSSKVKMSVKVEPRFQEQV